MPAEAAEGQRLPPSWCSKLSAGECDGEAIKEPCSAKTKWMTQTLPYSVCKINPYWWVAEATGQFSCEMST